MAKANDPIRELNKMIKVQQKQLDRLRQLDEEVRLGNDTSRHIGVACKQVFQAKKALIEAAGCLEQQRLDELLRRYDNDGADSSG